MDKGVGGLENQTIIMGVICVSSLILCLGYFQRKTEFCTIYFPKLKFGALGQPYLDIVACLALNASFEQSKQRSIAEQFHLRNNRCIQKTELSLSGNTQLTSQQVHSIRIIWLQVVCWDFIFGENQCSYTMAKISCSSPPPGSNQYLSEHCSNQESDRFAQVSFSHASNCTSSLEQESKYCL